MPGLVAVVAAVALSQAPGAPEVVRTCADAPAASALESVGLFEQRPVRDGRGAVVLDVSENSCSPAAGGAPAITDGLQLRVVPGPDGATVSGPAAARAVLRAGPGRRVAAYSALFGVVRADPGYEFALTATTAGGRRVELTGCSTGDDCGGTVRRSFDLPAETTAVEWSLSCVAARCSRAATGAAASRGLAASLNVYGSTAVTVDL